MAMDFFNPSLPQIQAEFSTSQNQIKNLMVVYLMILGLSQFFYGSFSDSRGRKPALIIGLSVEFVGMIVAYYAKDITMFYCARIVTAMGTAACTVISRAIIVDTIHEPRKLAKSFSYFAAAGQLSPALAPLIGSEIGIKFGWRMQFLCFAVIVLLSTMIIFFGLPETHLKSNRINTINRVEAYLLLLKNVNFMLFSIASAVVLAFTIGFYTTAPFAFHVLNISPVKNSYFYIMYSGSLIVGAIANSKISVKPNRVYVCCLYAYLGLFLISFVTQLPDKSIAGLVLFSIITGFICGIAAALTLTLSMNYIETSRGAASALQGSLKMFFTGVCLFIFDRVQITNFTNIALVFIAFAIILLTLYKANSIYYKKTSQKISSR